MDYILVVEDDTAIADTVKLVLEVELPYKVITVASAEVAARVLALFVQPPRFILLDIILPGKTGLEFGSELHKSEKYSAIPVICMTAGNMSANFVIKATSCKQFLRKPFNVEELLDSIRQVA
jgi:two-component system OmpR family response regulator